MTVQLHLHRQLAVRPGLVRGEQGSGHRHLPLLVLLGQIVRATCHLHGTLRLSPHAATHHAAHHLLHHLSPHHPHAAHTALTHHTHLAGAACAHHLHHAHHSLAHHPR